MHSVGSSSSGRADSKETLPHHSDQNVRILNENIFEYRFVWV
jgi:hypothetical protein